jgi:signal transduction histidine kinase/HAMP domain-containing protein
MLKRFNPLQTVRVRLLLAAILVEAVMLTLLVSNSLRLLHSHMTEQAHNQAEQIAPVLIAALVAPLAQNDQATVQAVLDESRSSDGIDYLAVLDRSGRPIAYSGWPMSKALPLPEEKFSLLSRGIPRYDVVVPVDLAGQELGSLHFGLNLSRIIAAQKQLLGQGIAIALVELLLSSGLLTVLGYWLTRHLAELTRISSAVAAGNLTPAHVPEGDDEIGRLGSAFNAMSRAIAERVGDLTAARDLQAALAATLEQEHSRMSALLGAMDVGILFVDANNQVIYENPSFHRIWHIDTRNTPIGQPLVNLFAGREAPPGLLEGSHPDTSTAQELTLADGRVLTQRCHPIHNAEERPLGWLWIYEDVSVAWIAARELRAAKEAAEAGNLAKASFLATMSHEIRTPMNGIIGMTDLLLMTPLDREQQEYLRWVQSSAASLLTILNDILDFSKIEAGHLDLERIPFALAPLLDEVIGVFSKAAAEKSLTLRWQAECRLPPNLLGDPVRLKQILNNLISNAIKFTDHGGVELRVDETVPAADGEKQLRFAVIDSGTGIPADRLQHIFQPFTQADNSITRRFGGTGLGLSIVQSLVSMMDGHIEVDSMPGRGSTFTFEAAFAPCAQLPTTPGMSPRPPVGKPGSRILLVEDTPVNQRLALALLEKAGYFVVIASDGLQAVELCQRESFDAILMDMQMPMMDGIEATRRIRALPGDIAHTPIIALTANAMAADREICLAAGMDDFLSKPFRANEMYACIARWIG